MQLLPPGQSKAVGVQRLLKQLQVLPQQMLANGDIDMLKLAGKLQPGTYDPADTVLPEPQRTGAAWDCQQGDQPGLQLLAYEALQVDSAPGDVHPGTPQLSCCACVQGSRWLWAMRQSR